MRMVLKTLHISERQFSWLKTKSKEIGISEAELVRRALDKEIEKSSKNKSNRSKSWQRIKKLSM